MRNDKRFRSVSVRVSVLYFVLFISGLISGTAYTASPDFPQTVLSNGLIKAKIYLPDATSGYYRSTRFDWSGALVSLQYKGHDFYGQWFDRVDPEVINWVHDGPEIVSGPCSALYGPVDEFQTPLGYNEAKPGETFIKIGVGVLERGEQSYNRYYPYKVVDSGKWIIRKEGKNAIEFIQELSDSKSGYAYEYHKIIRLIKKKPQMVIEHKIINTGQKDIKSTVYNHNFITIDKMGPGPDYTFRVPYKIMTSQPPDKSKAEVRENEVVYTRQLTGEDEVAVILQGFSSDIKDTEIIIENKKTGAGMKIKGDRPLTRSILWSVRNVLAVEPYIALDIKVGETFIWNNFYEYYTLP